MKKKDYTAPATENITLCTMNLLASSKIPIGGGTEGFDAPKQRGEWGNLWK